MKLQSKPFGQIKSGTKNIEIRLCDEKRQKIQVGDIIVFSCMDNELDTLQTKVTDLVQFDTFKELFSVYEPISYGFNDVDEYESMYQYYSEAEEQKYGVLAIHLQFMQPARVECVGR